jgi:micrococcal nuclease
MENVIRHPVLLSIAGIIVILILWRLFRGRRDPLPEPDPKCIWHTTVRELDKVYDGDTFYAHIKGHNPIDKKPAAIRIRGIDTPEMKDSRAAVKKKAEKAKAVVEEAFKNAGKIHLYNVSTADKYGRILASVFCDHKDLAKMLREKRLAKSYDGGTKEEW